MPEGPSIIIAKEQMNLFIGKQVLKVTGNSKTNIARMQSMVLINIQSWGKHLLLCFNGFTVRIHFLLFGSYLINEEKATPVRLGLSFNNGTINFYAASVKILENQLNELYDWEADVLNDNWNAEKAFHKIKKMPNEQLCDVLLEQEIFAGVGNIIKNEVLYRVKLHPESLAGKVTNHDLKAMITEARNYSFDFLKWKKEFTLKKHWLAHTKKQCNRCNLPLIKKQTGKKKRRSFFCISCQKLYV